MDYQQSLANAKPPILTESEIDSIFLCIPQIHRIHEMFQIELSNATQSWDIDERIGDVFTGAFNKALVFEIYSKFVNNYTTACETTKKLIARKPIFAEFLQQKQASSPDRLALTGLLIKPIQRFPQFILLLQDLLKSTPSDHQDRISLQRALSDLENLTHKLNETKRESENRYLIKSVLWRCDGKPTNFPKVDNGERYFIRQDDVYIIEYGENGEYQKKPRRIFLMNDQLLCVSVATKQGDNGSVVEKYKYKWILPIHEIDVIEASVPIAYKLKAAHGRLSLVSSKEDGYTTYSKDLDNLLHDLPLIEEITNLVSQLRLDHEGLSKELMRNITKSLQTSIQLKNDVNKCILQFCASTKTGGKGEIYTIQVESDETKQGWLLDLQSAKLSLDPRNKPGWVVPENEQQFVFKLPLFIKPLLCDISILNTRLTCSVSVILPSRNDPKLGHEHLWVCSRSEKDTDPGHVTIISFHTTPPHIVEAFQASEAAILCAESVTGYGDKKLNEDLDEDETILSEDSVWMGLVDKTVIVLKVNDLERKDSYYKFSIPNTPICLKFFNSTMFIGMVDGNIGILHRNIDGVWNNKNMSLLKLGDSAVNDLHLCNSYLWCCSGKLLSRLSVTAKLVNDSFQYKIHRADFDLASENKLKDCEESIKCVVNAGAGILVSYENSAVIKLYHRETFEYLQDINVASAIQTVAKDKKDPISAIHITSLSAAKGVLWIGTSVGYVLTLPLPRLQGVPQIHGRPNVSLHCQNSPIEFLITVSCSSIRIEEGDRIPSIFVEALERSPKKLKSLEIDREEKEGEEGEEGGEGEEGEGDNLKVRSDSLSSLKDDDDDDCFDEDKPRWNSLTDLDSVELIYGHLCHDNYIQTASSVLKNTMPREAQGLRFGRKLSRRFKKHENLIKKVRGGQGKKINDLRLSLEKGLNRNPSSSTSPTSPKSPTSPTSPKIPTSSERNQIQMVNKSLIVASGGQGHRHIGQENLVKKSKIRQDDVCLLLWQCRI
ncbi:DgyrCDS6679 [Dimorphilus gyrociliatus]|uniref:DgyrCDS6679 n=1 Tax=Dimorphilus gyrociliatus TaxID=2664684 RepID=A0A7I8VQB0_9ANNE|nr:DgyrCDS6679 [Dimorphilus gyrociliatus]